MNDDVFRRLRSILASRHSDRELYAAIVNTPFAYKVETTRLSLGIIVLLLANKADGQIHRIALSATELANNTQDMSVKRFEDIKIPIDYDRNAIAQVIRTQQPKRVTDWQYLFAPALTPAEARLNQAGGAIGCSVVYPLKGVGDGGALIFSYYQYPEHIATEHEAFMQTYSDIVAESLRARTPRVQQ